MGDTWAYGSGADPFRVSAFREIRRILREFVKVHGSKPYVDSFNRRLLMIPEHNCTSLQAYNLLLPKYSSLQSIRTVQAFPSYLSNLFEGVSRTDPIWIVTIIVPSGQMKLSLLTEPILNIRDSKQAGTRSDRF